ncbi:hypothetical protein F8M41_000298 [Gigaspora margarita]|uniref:Uncharacterized protein n=1 Tax=Gigaspora margarita TaxID=4874 RepID=A0A8H4A8R2_GIGMA|nr:hypothetical protein F8M41_000298 [Gigaspora margarita]
MSAKFLKQANKVAKNQAVFARIIAGTTISKSRETERSAEQSRGLLIVQIEHAPSNASGAIMDKLNELSEKMN